MKKLILFMTITLLFTVSSYADWKEDVHSLMGMGRLDEARGLINDYRRRDPADPYPVLLLARMDPDPDISQALYREAELLASKQRRPDRALMAEAVFSRAEILQVSGNNEQAAELYERIVKEFSTSANFHEAMLRLGGIRLISGDIEGALDIYRQAHSKSPRGSFRARAAIGIMECFVAMENWEEALAQGRRVLDEEDIYEGAIPRALEVMALAWDKRGVADNAEWYRERIVSLYPGSVQARNITRQLRINITDGSVVSAQQVHPAQEIEIPEPPQSYRPAPAEVKFNFTVQVASFASRENANNILIRLRNEGFDSRVEVITISGRQMYRVLVGRYVNRKDAEDIARRVEALTGNKAIVTSLE